MDGIREAGVVPGWATGVRRVAVLTGAGISTDSGIPDFRGPQGLWTRNPGAQQMSTYQAYVSDPELRRRSWRARGEHPAWRAEPNAAHLALAELATSAIDTWIVTQNIDGLHQKAGTPGGAGDRAARHHVRRGVRVLRGPVTDGGRRWPGSRRARRTRTARGAGGS